MAFNAGSIEVKLFASVAQIQKDMDKASKHIDSFSKRTEATLQRTGAAFKGLFAGITVNTLKVLADEYKKFDAQLKLATNTVEDYNKAYANVIRIGRVSMSDIGAIGVLYARLTNNLKDYGTTQKEISDITESVSLALRVSNATVQETNSVMLQLSQSFGSGRINGQEFLAVMEGAPILMRQLAKSINIPFGELKKLSEQGKLTADLLKQAWTDPAFLNLLRQQVKEVGTISSAYTVFVNNLKQFIGEADKASGASQLITQGIMLIADNINVLANIAIVALIASVGKWVASTYASIKASQLRQIELVKETVLIERKAAAEAKASAITTAAMANNARATTMWAAKNAGAFTENAAVMATVAQRTTVAAKAMGAFRNAIALLGGPIGATITILGSLAFAFASFGKKSTGEMAELLRITKELNEELSKTPEKIVAKSASSLENLAKVRDELQKDLARAKRGSIDFSTGQVFIDEQEIKRIEGLLDASLIRYQELTKARIDGESQIKQAVDESANATKALRDANIKLLSEQIAEQQNLIDLAKKANISEQDRLAIIADAQKKIKDLTGATKALKEEEKDAAKFAKEQLEDFQKRIEFGDKWIERQREILRLDNEYIASQKNNQIEINENLIDRIESLRKEVEEYGKLESQIEATALARAIERKEILKGLGLSTENLEEEIRLRKEIVDLAMSKERLDAEKKAAEESERAWKKAEEEKRREFEKTVDNIDRIFAEGFADMLNGGKSSWKSFTKSLITTFKTTVINEIYKLLLRPFVVNIIASVAGITGAGTASAEGLIGVGGNTGTGILGTISEGIRALNSDVVGSIQNLGVFIQDIPGLRDAAGWISTNADMIAKGFAYTGAVLSALQGDLKSAAFQAAGAFLGNLTPLGPVGGAIGSFIGGVIGGLFGGSGEKYKRVLQSNQSVFTGSQFSSIQTGSIRSSSEVSDFMAQTQEAFSRNLYLILNAFGQAADITTDIYARLRRTSGRTVGNFSYSFGGVSGSFNEQFGTEGDFAKGLELLSEKVLGQVLAEAIQKSNLPAAVKSLFEGITKAEEVNALISSIVQLSDAADGLNNRFGLTVDQAAQVAQSLGLAGTAAAEFISQFAGIASSFNGVGATILKIQQSLEGQFGGTLPSSLKEFDAALKAIDKTTQSGIDAFAQLLTLRPAFEEFTFAIDSLKAGVRASIFSMVSDQEKLLMQQEDMAKIFAEYGYEVPGSVAELVNLGKSIDFTTEAGLNLAAVFPNLVTVFMQTQETVNGLVNSLAALDSSRFKTLFEFTRANAYAAAGIPLSSLPSYASGTSFVPNDGPAMIHRGERILTAEENRRYESNDTIALEIRGLREENMNMRAELRSIAVSSRDAARTLDRLQRGGFILSDVDLNGDPQILKVEVV